MIQEALCIWHLDEWCKSVWGSIYLEGGINQGKYYKVDRLVLCEMLNEMLCWASARLALQTKMKYEGEGGVYEEEQDEEEDEDIENKERSGQCDEGEGMEVDGDEEGSSATSKEEGEKRGNEEEKEEE